MKVFYIGGYMRSGTTLLCQLLGRATDALDAGEVFGIWSHAAGGASCSCGSPLDSCELWGEALQSTGVPSGAFGDIAGSLARYLRTRNFYRARREIRNRTVPGDVRRAIDVTQTLLDSALTLTGRSILVDSSKGLPGLLLHLAAGNEVVGVAHLVRDARAVVASEVRSLRVQAAREIFAPPGHTPAKSMVGWYGSNAALAIGLRSLDLPAVRLRYEDLATNPDGILDALATRFELPRIDPSKEAHTSHLAVGNPARMSFSGAVRLDERWRDELGHRQLTAIKWVSAPAAALLKPTLQIPVLGTHVTTPLEHPSIAANTRPIRPRRRVERIVFWQDAPSIHFAPLIKAVADVGIETHVVTERETKPDRLALGWPVPDYGKATLHPTPGTVERRTLERQLGPDSHHMFHGVGPYPETTKSLHWVASARHPATRLSIFSEAWNPTGLRGLARPLRYRRWVRSTPEQVDLYFLAGRLARAQFASVGVEPDSMRPIIYTVSADPRAEHLEPSAPVLFVGKLEPRKRVDRLIRAYAEVRDQLARPLLIIGDGPERARLRTLVNRLDLGGLVTFSGAVDNPATVAQMRRARGLVLPSAFDGWGAVINEALHAGCAVVAASTCGAVELLGAGRGQAFSTAGELEAALTALGPDEDLNARATRAAWAAQATDPQRVAEYLIDVFESPAGIEVPPPWL